MRSIFILVPLVCHFALLTHALGGFEGEHPVPEPATGPKNPTYENPSGSTSTTGEDGTNGQDKGDAIGVPGALASGKNPKPSLEDDGIDFDEIADKLKDLIEKIRDAADDSAQSSSTTTATITQGPLPASATPCSSALDAYSLCSAAFNPTFSAVAVTVQAGCLCNAYSNFDFNGEMEGCYSYAQNQIQYQSYASVIANATNACTYMSNSGAARGLSACLGAVVVAAALASMSILF